MIRGVPPALAESIADHLLLAAVLALGVAELLKAKGRSVDAFKAAAIVLVHDLPEALVDDVAARSEEARELKKELEAKAAEELEEGFARSSSRSTRRDRPPKPLRQSSPRSSRRWPRRSSTSQWATT